MSFLTIDKLSKQYDKQTVLDKISISMEQGEFLVLLGPSGCGKSTLLNCIAGLLKYDDGAIYINDKNMNDVHPSKRDIAMVFQSYALYPNMNVRENIAFGMKIRKESKEEIERKIEEVSKVLNMSNLLDRKPSELSGGQQQRVAIGRALVRDPMIFLFDEPLSNLDAKLREAMRTEIKRLHKRLKNTIIYVTHDQAEAMSLADKIAVLNKGEVVQFATPHDIYFRPQTIFVAEFIGSPPMNLLPCKVVKNGNDFNVTLKNYDQEISFVIPIKDWSSERIEKLDEYCQKSQDLIMGIRPENIHHGDNISRLVQACTLSLKVEMIQPIGADNLIITDFDGKQLDIRLHSDLDLPKLEETTDFFMDIKRVVFYCPQDGTLLA